MTADTAAETETAHAPPGEMSGACRGPDSVAPESGVLQAGASEHCGIASRPRRFVIVEPASGYHEVLIAPGVVSAIESPEGQRAPVRSMVIVADALDAPSEHLAEREVDRWVVQ